MATFTGMFERIDTVLSAVERASLADVLSSGGAGSALRSIQLERSRCRLVTRNDGVLFYSVYPGLCGAFTKRSEQKTWGPHFGRCVCDAVRDEMRSRGFPHHAGFFTSDELPCYGLSRAESRCLRALAGETARGLVAVFAYPEFEAAASKRALDHALAVLREHYAPAKLRA